MHSVEALNLKPGDNIDIHVRGDRSFAMGKAPGARDLLARIRAHIHPSCQRGRLDLLVQHLIEEQHLGGDARRQVDDDLATLGCRRRRLPGAAFSVGIDLPLFPFAAAIPAVCVRASTTWPRALMARRRIS